MLVPSSLVNLDGSQCNMVGTGYTAFANQAVSPLVALHSQLVEQESWLAQATPLLPTGL